MKDLSITPESDADMTTQLLATSPGSIAEFQRYLAVAQRQITVPDESVRELVSGRTVLVTGDSGCIGSALLRQLDRYHPRRLVGVSLDAPATPRPGAQHRRLDIRDGQALRRLVHEVAPDVVFHLAAQRDPGLAERAVHRTVSTNVLGTRNVVAACESTAVPRLVYASTGKALRPYTSCLYAATKRVSERIVGDAATRGELQCSVVRFTHVVDNAILLQRLRRWCRTEQAIRLHDVATVFYVQSAIESAQLQLTAAVSPPDGVFRLYAIRDLGWPVNLLDLALGAVHESGCAVPIQEIGHEPGYEREPYPGLYDPTRSGEVSPLLNAIEAASVEESASPEVDAVRHDRGLTAELRHRISTVEAMVAAAAEPSALRAGFDELAWADLRQTVRDTPAEILGRITEITAPHRPGMIDEHRRMDDVARQWLAQLGARHDAVLTGH